jgi:hypothetical protein
VYNDEVGTMLAKLLVALKVKADPLQISME